MQSHIGLLAGLGSSLFWSCNPWSAWARTQEVRLKRHYKDRKDVVIHAVSSDLSGERRMREAVLNDHRKGLLKTVVGGGHSNGARDWLFVSQAFHAAGIQIPYAFAIDMTLGEFGAEVYGNTNQYDEFWAGLQKADFHASFTGNHKIYDVDKIEKRNVGHTPAASLPWVQDRIFQQITEAVQ